MFDEARASITQELCGRTVDRVERHGKELRFVCNDGKEVVLQADVNGDIRLRRVNVRVYLPLSVAR